MSIDDVQDRVADDLESSFEVPDKYKGKSVNDLVKMHMETEKDRSRLGNEVHTLRTLSDQLLGLQHTREDKPRKETKPITADELLTNPEEAIERAVQSNPEVTQTKEELQRLRAEIAQTKFEKSFPNYTKDIENPEFAEWVKGNRVRTALGVAANSGDYGAAESLWSLWAERQEELKADKAKQKEIRQKQEKLGLLEGSGATGNESDKILKRSDLMELHRKALNGDPAAKAKWNDPTFQAERLRAYVEKRVK